MSFWTPKDIRGGNLFALFTAECGGTEAVAAFLMVSERTVRTWLAKGTAPRSAVVALFWETQYGRSQIFADQVNEIRLLYRRVAILEAQYAKAGSVIATLRRIQGDTANDVFFEELPAAYSLPTGRYADSSPLHAESAATQPSAGRQAHGA